MDNFALTIEKHVNQQGNTDCIFNVSVWFTYYPSAVNPLNMSLMIFIVWNVTSVPPFFIGHVCMLGTRVEACGYLNQRRQLHIPFICYKNNEQNLIKYILQDLIPLKY